MKCAEAIGLPVNECIVFEDAEAGVKAAHNAGMVAVGIGSKARLPQAELNLDGFNDITPQDVLKQLQAL